MGAGIAFGKKFVPEGFDPVFIKSDDPTRAIWNEAVLIVTKGKRYGTVADASGFQCFGKCEAIHI